jgi:hypothetical protein
MSELAGLNGLLDLLLELPTTVGVVPMISVIFT